MLEFKIEKIKIVERPRKLKGDWTCEFINPTREEQEEINKDCGVVPCKICGSHLHGWECHAAFEEVLK